MKIDKRIIKNLNKCYSVAPLSYRGSDCFLVAAEKNDPCYLFDINGEQIDKIWDGPGGVMSMTQIPETDGQFLATQKFYSPNDSKEAKIVLVNPGEKEWKVRTFVELPHVHRFDLLQRNGHTYLIACTLKTEHKYKDDWSSPGKVYWAELPKDLSPFDKDYQLELSILEEGLLKNHGYYRVLHNGIPSSLISSENGVFLFTPPESEDRKWEKKRLLSTPASDAVLVDLNNDGIDELCTIAPFHGETVSIYELKNDNYQKVYTHPEPLEFSHAVYSGDLAGIPTLVIGHREGKKALIAITFDQESKSYISEVIDSDCGPANVLHISRSDHDLLIAANRESDEIALYKITE